jgi:hypothetical protein
MTTLSALEQEVLSGSFAKALTKEERKRQLMCKIKVLHAELASLEQSFSRVETGLPEPYKFDREWVPPFLRKQDEAKGDKHSYQRD